MEMTGCRIIYYGNKDAEFSIYDIGDIHIMNKGCAWDVLYRDIEKIKDDPCAFWFEGGDYAEWIMPSDKRFDADNFPDDVKVKDLNYLSAIVANKIINTFKPITNKNLGFLIGNHEYKFMTRQHEKFIHTAICDKLKVSNMLYSGWTDIYFVYKEGLKIPYKIVTHIPPENFEARLRVFVHHGMGSANTAGGKLNTLKRMAESMDADLIMMGHLHEQFTKTFVRLFPNYNCTQIQERITMGLITGSYLRYYESGIISYGETRGYYPTVLGASRARYIPSTMEITVESRAITGSRAIHTPKERYLSF